MRFGVSARWQEVLFIVCACESKFMAMERMTQEPCAFFKVQFKCVHWAEWLGALFVSYWWHSHISRNLILNSKRISNPSICANNRLSITFSICRVLVRRLEQWIWAICTIRLVRRGVMWGLCSNYDFSSSTNNNSRTKLSLHFSNYCLLFIPSLTWCKSPVIISKLHPKCRLVPAHVNTCSLLTHST